MSKPAAEPIIIICLPGCKPALLDYVLNAQEEVYCLPVDLGPILQEFIRVIKALCEGRPSSSEPQSLKMQLYQEARRSMDRAIGLASRRHHKNIWCEQSLSTLDYLQAFGLVYPQARYICLDRHGMDFVHLAMRPILYGFSGAGYERHILNNPHVNGYQSLAAYWCEQTDRISAFEKERQNQCFRIKCESVLFEPQKTLAALFSFLQLKCNSKLLEQAFQSHYQSRDDLKKLRAVHEREKLVVGQGRTVSARLINPATLERMNFLLGETGYNKVDKDWNTKTPAHLMYDRGDSLTKQYAIKKLNQIFGHWIPEQLRRKPLPKLVRNKIFGISIKDMPDANWQIDLGKGDCFKVRTLEKIDHTMIIGFETMVKLTSNEVNLTMAIANGTIHCSGDKVFFENIRRVFA